MLCVLPGPPPPRPPPSTSHSLLAIVVPSMRRHIILLLLSSLQAYCCHAFLSQFQSRNQLFRPHSSSKNEGDDGALNFLQGIFQPTKEVAELPPAIPDFVVDSDYTIAALFATVGVSTIAVFHGLLGGFVGGFITLLSVLFAVQAGRIKFVFDQEAFELKMGEDLTDSGENIVVGGANRWTYDSFVNWDFFPSLGFPILVYFKETQTPKADGSEPGQIHFFPAGMYSFHIKCF